MEEETKDALLEMIPDCFFARGQYEILSEEDKEIEIQAITCFNEIRDISTWSNDTLSFNQRKILSKINQLIKAIKQLDKKIK